MEERQGFEQQTIWLKKYSFRSIRCLWTPDAEKRSKDKVNDIVKKLKAEEKKKLVL